MAYVLLHNPQCATSRTAKELLDARGVDVTVRRYLDEPLSLDELRILKAKLGRPPAEWIRWKEAVAAETGITPDDPPMTLLRAIAEHPRLLERPILIGPETAAVGRPKADAVLAALETSA